MKQLSTLPKGQAGSHVVEFGLEELAWVLLEKRGIKSGLWKLGARLRFAGLTSNMPLPEGGTRDMPTGMVAVEGLALHPAAKPGPLVFDAAKPPAPPARARARNSSR
jgi:hypothetical protein